MSSLFARSNGVVREWTPTRLISLLRSMAEVPGLNGS